MNVKALVAHLCLTLQPHEAVLSMEFSRQDTGVGGHSLCQGIFPTQGSNLGFLHCRQILFFCFFVFFLQADSLPSESPGNLKLFKRVYFQSLCCLTEVPSLNQS